MRQVYGPKNAPPANTLNETEQRGQCKLFRPAHGACIDLTMAPVMLGSTRSFPSTKGEFFAWKYS